MELFFLTVSCKDSRIPCLCSTAYIPGNIPIIPICIKTFFGSLWSPWQSHQILRLKIKKASSQKYGINARDRYGFLVRYFQNTSSNTAKTCNKNPQKTEHSSQILVRAHKAFRKQHTAYRITLPIETHVVKSKWRVPSSILWMLVKSPQPPTSDSPAYKLHDVWDTIMWISLFTSGL